MEISELKQIAERMKEMDEKLDILIDLAIPEENPCCPLCGVEEGSIIGTCAEEDCPYKEA